MFIIRFLTQCTFAIMVTASLAAADEQPVSQEEPRNRPCKNEVVESVIYCTDEFDRCRDLPSMGESCSNAKARCEKARLQEEQCVRVESQAI